MMRLVSIPLSLFMLVSSVGCSEELVLDKLVVSLSSDQPLDGQALTELRIRFYAAGIHYPEVAQGSIADINDIPAIEIDLNAFMNPVAKPIIFNLPYNGTTFAATKGVVTLHATAWAGGTVATYFEGEVDLNSREVLEIRLNAIDPSCDADGDGFLNCNILGCCADGSSPLGDCEPDALEANPWATEAACEPCADELDQDCSGSDQPCVDADDDGIQDCLEEAEDCGVDDPAVGPGLAEICDGIDNNCDGQTDEGFFLAVGSKLLYLDDDCGSGLCEGGKVECDAASPTGLSCSTAGKAVEEDCEDDLDNDCDGQVNNGCTQNDWDGDGQTEDEGDTAPYDSAYHENAEEGCCPASLAATPAGVTICDKNLDGDFTPCDAADKDGDGQVPPQDCDDNDPTIYDGAPEKCGDGILQGCFSDPECKDVTDNDGDQWSPPDDCDDTDPEIHPGAFDICDGVDNNCNGVVDEGNPGTNDGAPCGQNEGLCEYGTTVCANGSGYVGTIVCADETKPAADVCDEEDNDCDEKTDEPYKKGGTVTLTDLNGDEDLVKGDDCGTGACSGGSVICGASKVELTCDSYGQGSPEVCDGIDNDCDGEIDEDFKTDGAVTYVDLNGDDGLVLGDSCGTGDCAGGKVQCNDDKTTLTCSTANKASQDICDDHDNDCDGAVDEDYYPGGSVTFTDLNGDADLALGEGCGVGACDGGVVICALDELTLTCSTSGAALVDVCDGDDNDCDGKSDEDYKNGGSVKYTDLNGQGGKVLGGSCGTGACQGGKVECAPDTISLRCTTEGNEAIELCDGADNDCDGLTDEDFKQNGTVKYTSLDGTKNLTLNQGCGKGACSGGKVECSGDGVTLTCSTNDQASPDLCDNTDNNCNGKTDEDFKLDGGVTLDDLNEIKGLVKGNGCGTGACAGGSVNCSNDGTHLICTTHSKAHADICDGLDNDCDGKSDEDFKEDGAVSMEDLAGNKDLVLGDDCGAGVCAGGKVQCGDDKSSLKCSKENLANPDVCDSKDNDCDGDVDEDFKQGGSFTFTDLSGNFGLVLTNDCGEGACNNGEVVCSADGSSMECDSEGNASAEICDNADNDCDGDVDENFKPGGSVTMTDLAGNANLALNANCGAGDCAGGKVVCDGAKTGLECNKESSAQVESCDEKDNDCDGETDEDYTNGDNVMTDLAGNAGLVKGNACGAGDCAGGTVVCNGGGNGLECNSESNAAQETCDEKDNDCDGDVDETFKDGGITTTDLAGNKNLVKGDACGAGICDGGVVTCTANGAALECPGDDNASNETCDDKDNDCDGTVDENYIAGGNVNMTDLAGNANLVKGDACGEGECAGGVVTCKANGSGIECLGDNSASNESCDDKDNDCDGTVDENYIAGGNVKMTDLAGNANLVKGDSCGEGECAGGVVTCKANGSGIECLGDNSASNEACDDKDNDCDGTVDEDYIAGGKVKITDLAGNANLVKGDSCGEGECAGGVVTCKANGSGIECLGDNSASNESCDDKDNDCDGNVDENYIAGGNVKMTDLAGNANLVKGDSCGEGECAGGVVTCKANGSGIECLGDNSASNETCDDKDNDCDGNVDENYVAGGNVTITDLAGNSGLAKGDACGAGICSGGVVTCTGNGAALECLGDDNTVAETCDGDDNDCDGSTDESLGQTTCGQGECDHTVDNCVNGVAQNCDPNEGAVAELCDNLDNDCDGPVDEDFKKGGNVSYTDLSGAVRTLGQSCGVGDCSGGTVACDAAKTGLTCPTEEGAGSQVSTEACNGVDNDCNNVVDNGVDAEDEGACLTSVGVCKDGVTATCGGISSWSCDFLSLDHGDESRLHLCDALDNNCDGSVDENCVASYGNVSSVAKVSHTQGGLVDPLADDDGFGTALAALGDFDNTGSDWVAVGAYTVDGGGTERGALWLLKLAADGSVSQSIKIDEGDLQSGLNDSDHFGEAIANLGDVNGDGITDIAVGASGTDDGGTNNTGAVYVLLLNADGSIGSEVRIDADTAELTGSLAQNDRFGFSVAGVGDLDGDGVPDLVVGTPGEDVISTNAGAIWMLFLNSDGSVKSARKTSVADGLPLSNQENFGYSVAALGDVNGDGITDLAVGATGYVHGPSGDTVGAVYVLFQNADGSVKAHQLLTEGEGGFTSDLKGDGKFGSAVTGIGDFDQDGIPDLAVGGTGDPPEDGSKTGSIWILTLDILGQVVSSVNIYNDVSGFPDGTLDADDRFGSAIASPGSLDADGIPDLLVGALGDDDGGSNRGAFHVLFSNQQ